MTRVPLNDLSRLYDENGPALEEAAARILRSGWWIDGPETAAFCEAFAAYLGAEHCIGVGNGTDALDIALRVLIDAGPPREGRPEVVTVANAGGYASTACHLLGAVPVFVDIEEATQLIDPAALPAALGPDTAAVVATHLYGGFADVPALRRTMDGAGYAHVPILEDCAQAHGLTGPDGRRAGTFGDMATFSFYPTKNLGAFGDGGAVVTADPAHAAATRRLRQYGWEAKYRIGQAGGRNSRLDEMQAALLHTMLPRLDRKNDRRRTIVEAYRACAPDGIEVVHAPGGTVAHLAIVLCDRRDALRAHLEERGIATDLHYPVLDCDQSGWRDMPARIAPGGLDVSRRSVERILTLPCFPFLRDDELEKVCDALRAFEAP